jgi:hypothetical protein
MAMNHDDRFEPGLPWYVYVILTIAVAGVGGLLVR